jgi:hypothetical protein
MTEAKSQSAAADAHRRVFPAPSRCWAVYRAHHRPSGHLRCRHRCHRPHPLLPGPVRHQAGQVGLDDAKLAATPARLTDLAGWRSCPASEPPCRVSRRRDPARGRCPPTGWDARSSHRLNLVLAGRLARRRPARSRHPKARTASRLVKQVMEVNMASWPSSRRKRRAPQKPLTACSWSLTSAS